jgi:hypothetical protein
MAPRVPNTKQIEEKGGNIERRSRIAEQTLMSQAAKKFEHNVEKIELSGFVHADADTRTNRKER